MIELTGHGPGGATFLKGIVVNHLLCGALSGVISPPFSPF